MNFQNVSNRASLVGLQLFDDHQLFDDQLEVWTLIIRKSTVIPPSLMVLFSQLQMDCAKFDISLEEESWIGKKISP